MIIAVDGPVAAGKGTLARRIADRYGLHYLDTGALYRAVALNLIRAGQDPGNKNMALEAAKNVGNVSLDDPDLRAEETGNVASTIAVNQEVRNCLLSYQRDYANRLPGAVLDGRDIGTVVCPQADVKLFVTASDEVRATRRHKELEARGILLPYEEVLADLQDRDARDSDRGVAPLKKAVDAYLLDTTKLDIEAALDAACEIIDRSLSKE